MAPGTGTGGGGGGGGATRIGGAIGADGANKELNAATSPTSVI